MQPDWSCCCTPRSADIFPVVPSLQAIVVVVVIAFEEYFENLPYTCLQVLFFKPRIHTEFLVIIFVRAENRSSTLVWETRGRLLSEVFERKADFLYSQHLPKKNYSFIASRVEKKSWNMVKITFSCSLRSKRLLESWTRENKIGMTRLETLATQASFLVQTITFFTFFLGADYLSRGPRTEFADQGSSSTVAFCRITSNILKSGTGSFLRSISPR